MKIAVGAFRMNYQEYGEGLPLLILHGWGGNSAIMVRMLEGAVDWGPNIRRIYADLPCHGESKTGSSVKDSDQILENMMEFISKIIGDREFLLLGYSYGGYLARGIVFHRFKNIRGLCLLNPVITPRFEDRKVPELKVMEATVELDPQGSELHKTLDEILVVRNRKTLEYMETAAGDLEYFPGEPELRESIQNDIGRYGLSFDPDAASRPFSMPTLLCASRQDVAVGYQDAWTLLSLYPRATYVAMDRSGHFLEDQQHLLNCLIKDWLRRVNLDAN